MDKFDKIHKQFVIMVNESCSKEKRFLENKFSELRKTEEMEEVEREREEALRKHLKNQRFRENIFSIIMTVLIAITFGMVVYGIFTL